MPNLKKKRTALHSIENQQDKAGPSETIRGPNLNEKDKSIVWNARDYFQRISDGEVVFNPKQVVKNAALCCGVSEATVRKLSKQMNDSLDNTPPSPKKSTGRPKIHIDEYFHAKIRQKVHSFYLRKLYPTVEDVHREIKQDNPDFPTMCTSTFLTVMKSIGFFFGPYNSKSVCFESPRIADMRHKYLRSIKRYRDCGYSVWYTDETWAGANHSLQNIWLEKVSGQERPTIDFERGKIQEVNGVKGGVY
jgi:hypothetical protein